MLVSLPRMARVSTWATEPPTLDIEDHKVDPISLPNIEFRVKDALEDRHDLLSSPLVVLDTAHDGVFERPR